MWAKYQAVVACAALGGAAVSLLFGRRFASQCLLIAVVAFLASGRRYRWFYILYKTLPRDIRALRGFIQMNIMLLGWSRKRWNVAKIFSEQAKKCPDKVAFIFEKREWTFKMVDEFSNQIANYFKLQGFKRDDTIALFMESKPEFVCVWLGLSKIGVVTALINSNLQHSSLVHCIQTANSKAVILGEELIEPLSVVRHSLKLPVYQYPTDGVNKQCLEDAIDLKKALDNSSQDPLTEDVAEGKPEDKLVYIYTSGTTGLPKAAIFNNTRFMFMVAGVNRMLNITPEDRLYDPLPLYHTAGGMVGVGQALLMGSSVVIRKKFSASNFWTDCVANNCTVAQYIGEICRYLLSTPSKPEESQHSIRLMFGNGLRPQIWQQFVDRFKIKQIGEFYGATEGNSNLVNIDSKVGAVGFVPRYASFVYPVALIKVEDSEKPDGTPGNTEEPLRGSNGFCTRCSPGETGILIGKINKKVALNSFSGYADKAASQKKIITDVFSKGDQYFNTGDVLTMDEFGYFYFKDRTGDTFRWRGENVSTAEVEAVVSNAAGLRDAIVYGVQVPDTEGRAGMAAIFDESGKLDLDVLATGVKQNLPTYARPIFVRVLDEPLPMTGTFKMKKIKFQQDGYSEKATGKLFLLDPATGRYIPLTNQLREGIKTGKIRI